MKKVSIVLMLLLALCLAVGCADDQNSAQQSGQTADEQNISQPSSQTDNGKKLCRLEIYSAADNKLLATVDDQRLIDEMLDDALSDVYDIETESGDDFDMDDKFDADDKYDDDKYDDQYDHDYDDMLKENPVPNAVPQYKLVCSQQKTLLAGEDPAAERDYEEIVVITTYENSRFLQVQLSDEVLHGVQIPADLMTYYCEMDDDFAAALKRIV